jgi:hypothetical protein
MQENADTVAVYSFEVWDRVQGKNVVAPYMAAPDAIRRMKGMADLGSKIIVPKAALDSRGFYSSDKAPS